MHSGVFGFFAWYSSVLQYSFARINTTSRSSDAHNHKHSKPRGLAKFAVKIDAKTQTRAHGHSSNMRPQRVALCAELVEKTLEHTRMFILHSSAFIRRINCVCREYGHEHAATIGIFQMCSDTAKNRTLGPNVRMRPS